MERERKPWDSYGKARTSEMRIPTVPRIAPHPISSGISTRELPEARLLEIVKCCQHYEAKCAGLYSAKTPAARFLFDLSREVQDLCRVLVSREDQREGRVEHLEGSLADWEGIFASPSAEMQAVGVPAHNAKPSDVARALLQQAAARRRAEDEREVAAASHREEVASLRAALRDQAEASQAAAAAQVDQARRATARQADADARRAREATREADAAAAAAAEAARRQADDEWQAELEALEARHAREMEEAAGQARAAVQEAREREQATRRAAQEAAQAREQAEARAAGQERLVRERDSQLQAREQQHRHAMQALEGDARGALAAAEQRHRASVEAGRLRQLEGHCDWLSRRVAQLEELVESLSGALRKAGKSGLAGAGARFGGAQAGGAGSRPVWRGAGTAGAGAAKLKGHGHGPGTVRAGGLLAQERQAAAERPFRARTRPGVGVKAGSRARPASAAERRARGLGKGRGVPLMGTPGGIGGRGRGAVLAWVEGPAVGGDGGEDEESSAQAAGSRAGPVYAAFGAKGGSPGSYRNGAATTSVDGKRAAAMGGADLVVLA